MIKLIDANGNSYGGPFIVVIGADGKIKSVTGTGGSPTGPAGGDLTGSYPNPGVNWSNGLSVYNLLYYPLASNPAGYLTAITSGQIIAALGYTPVNQAGDSMLGYLTLNADPTSALQAATKQYVDNITAGINFHTPCHAATTGNLSATYLNGVSGVGATLTSTVNAALVVDSHTLALGERVLVWQQSAGLQNGIYDVTDTGSVTTPWILTRSTDADNSPSGELQNGDFCFIQQGATYGGFGFILNTTGTITVGTTAINYVQFNAAQVITAGFGLQELTPNVLSVDTSLIATVASLGSYLTTTSAAATYVPQTRTITINGTTQDLSADRTFTVTTTDPAGWTTIVKSANQDVTNNSTLQDDTELQFSVVAGGHYMVEMNLSTSGNNVSADYRWQLSVSSGTMKLRGYSITIASGGAFVISQLSALGVSSTSNQTVAILTADLDYLQVQTIKVQFTASNNATFNYKFSNNSAIAGAISRTWKGSILKYKRID